MDKEKIISLENLNQYSEETSGKIKKKIAEHTDNGDIHVTVVDKNNWNGKVDSNQGTSNAGKLLGTNSNGDVVAIQGYGFEYDETTKMLKYGTDPTTNLNQGIGLDNTLSKKGYAAEASAVGELKSDLNDVENDISTIIIKSKNMVDTTKSVIGFLANSDGDITSNVSYKTTDFLPIESGKKYAMSPRIRKLLVYRPDQYPDYSFPMVDGWFTDYIFTAPRDGLIRVTYSITEESIFQIEEGDTVTEYMPYGAKKIVTVNPLKGKTVYAFGDSLMYGHVSAEGMLDALCNVNEMNLTKYAFNGANIVLFNEIETQVNNASANIPDFVIFDGLMNDALNSKLYTSKLGELSNSFDLTTFDTTTFYGAFEHLLSVIRNKYINANIIFVCCHKTPTRDYNGQILLQKAVRECCEKWSIPYVNIFNHGQINCYIDNMRNAYSYNNEGETSGGNGTHLTGDGYKKWYAPMIKAKMIELLQE